MDISLQKVEHRYQANTPFERLALYDIDLNIPSGQFLAIIGHTGSGKSTIIQHLNALLKPTAGTLEIGDHYIRANKKVKNVKQLRKKVGIVFQFPEYQLFEETVEKDICFGPMNLGVPESDAREKARDVIKRVGLTEDFLQKSPFELSGGQMRRVAIAGVLAMEPEVLVLDEPTAGLDPRGRQEIMQMFSDLHTEQNITTILVTHSMEDATNFAERIVIIHNGTVKCQGKAQDVFSNPDELKKYGLDLPDVLRFAKKVEKKFGITFTTTPLTIEQLTQELTELLIKEDTENG